MPGVHLDSRGRRGAHRRFTETTQPPAFPARLGLLGAGGRNDPGSGHRPPESAVVGFATDVAHHVPVILRHLERCREVALRHARFAAFDVVVGLELEGALARRLAEYMAFADVDFVVRSSHDPLDELDACGFALRLRAGGPSWPDRVRHRAAYLLLSVLGRMEDDNTSDP